MTDGVLAGGCSRRGGDDGDDKGAGMTISRGVGFTSVVPDSVTGG